MYNFLHRIWSRLSRNNILCTLRFIQFVLFRWSRDTRLWITSFIYWDWRSLQGTQFPSQRFWQEMPSLRCPRYVTLSSISLVIAIYCKLDALLCIMPRFVYLGSEGFRDFGGGHIFTIIGEIASGISWLWYDVSSGSCLTAFCPASATMLGSVHGCHGQLGTIAYFSEYHQVHVRLPTNLAHSSIQLWIFPPHATILHCSLCGYKLRLLVSVGYNHGLGSDFV